jgi:hypothetical protein
MGLLDGRRGIPEVQAAWTQRTGEVLLAGHIERIVKLLVDVSGDAADQVAKEIDGLACAVGVTG